MVIVVFHLIVCYLLENVLLAAQHVAPSDFHCKHQNNATFKPRHVLNGIFFLCTIRPLILIVETHVFSRSKKKKQFLFTFLTLKKKSGFVCF